MLDLSYCYTYSMLIQLTHVDQLYFSTFNSTPTWFTDPVTWNGYQIEELSYLEGHNPDSFVMGGNFAVYRIKQ